MKFNEIVTSEFDVEDDIVLEYINNKGKEKDYAVQEFIDFLCERYYMGDFQEHYDIKYDLKQEDFIKEISRILEENDRERIS